MSHDDYGARMASFSIIRHRNWERKFYRAKQLGPKLVFPTNLVSVTLNFILSFPFFVSASTAAAKYIFTAPTCTTTMITLEPCALNDSHEPRAS
jgi:hypothetical protein